MEVKQFLREQGYTIDAIVCKDDNLTSGKIDLPKLMELYSESKQKEIDRLKVEKAEVTQMLISTNDTFNRLATEHLELEKENKSLKEEKEKLKGEKLECFESWHNTKIENNRLNERVKELEKDRHDHLECEKCDWDGLESELITEPLTEGQNHSEYALCPKCKTDLS